MAISYQRTQSVIKVIFGAEKPQQPETRPENTTIAMNRSTAQRNRRTDCLVSSISVSHSRCTHRWQTRRGEDRRGSEEREGERYRVVAGCI